MTINYKGKDDNYKYRIAEISFFKEEEKLFERMEKILSIKGWNDLQVVDEMAILEVEDYEEYKMFVKDYKEAKQSVKLWEKFGI